MSTSGQVSLDSVLLSALIVANASEVGISVSYIEGILNKVVLFWFLICNEILLL